MVPSICSTMSTGHKIKVVMPTTFADNERQLQKALEQEIKFEQLRKQGKVILSLPMQKDRDGVWRLKEN